MFLRVAARTHTGQASHATGIVASQERFRAKPESRQLRRGPRIYPQTNTHRLEVQCNDDVRLRSANADELTAGRLDVETRICLNTARAGVRPPTPNALARLPPMALGDMGTSRPRDECVTRADSRAITPCQTVMASPLPQTREGRSKMPCNVRGLASPLYGTVRIGVFCGTHAPAPFVCHRHL